MINVGSVVDKSCQSPDMLVLVDRAKSNKSMLPACAIGQMPMNTATALTAATKRAAFLVFVMCGFLLRLAPHRRASCQRGNTPLATLGQVDCKFYFEDESRRIAMNWYWGKLKYRDTVLIAA